MNRIKLLAIITLIISALFLRSYKYMYSPPATHGEELLYVWSGYSLLTKGVPISWSNLDAYQKKHVYFDGRLGNPKLHNTFGTKLFKPWLDEPPLFSLIVGLPLVLTHTGTLTDIPPAAVFRIPMLFISLFILILIYKLAKQLFGYKVAFWSTFIYGFAPFLILSNRLAIAENLITLLFLLLAWLTLKLQNKPKKLILWAVLISLIAGFTKPTGAYISLLPAVYLWKKKKHRYSLLTIFIPQVVFWLLFGLYGHHYDWQLFLGLIRQQGFRPAGFASLAYIFSTPAYDIKVFLDSWYYLHLLSLFVLIISWRFTKDEKVEFILWSAFIWLFIFVLSSGQTDLLPWYRYPLFGFTAIAFGYIFNLLIKHGVDIFSYFSLILLSLGNLVLLDSPFPPPSGYRMSSLLFRSLVLILLLPVILASLRIKRKACQKIATGLLIFTLLFSGFFVNSWYIYRAYGLKCDNVSTCCIPNMTGRKLFKVILK